MSSKIKIRTKNQVLVLFFTYRKQKIRAIFKLLSIPKIWTKLKWTMMNNFSQKTNKILKKYQKMKV